MRPVIVSALALVVIALVVIAPSAQARKAGKGKGKALDEAPKNCTKFGPESVLQGALALVEQYQESGEWENFEPALEEYFAKEAGEGAGTRFFCSGTTCARRTQRAVATNGCSLPINIVPAHNALFTPCCHTHDRCYGTCGSTKSSCDSSFLSCMNSACPWWNPVCKGIAAAYYAAVLTFGCSSYQTAQRNTCVCTTSG